MSKGRNSMTKNERKNERAKLGMLRHNRVQKRTLRRYENAVGLFFAWLADVKTWPDGPEELASWLAEYAEELWEQGEGRHLLGDAISGLIFYVKGLKRKLPDAWSQYDTWKSLERPVRATPCSLLVLQASVGVALSLKDIAMAAALLMGFQCLLRTKELLNIQVGHVQLSRDETFMMVDLGMTKGGLRRKEQEQVVIDDTTTMLAVLLAMEGKQPGETIALAESIFRARFRSIFKRLGLSTAGYFPYSLRRGGATELFLQTGQLSVVEKRGRWQQTRTAKIYISMSVSWREEPSCTAVSSVNS